VDLARSRMTAQGIPILDEEQGPRRRAPGTHAAFASTSHLAMPRIAATRRHETVVRGVGRCSSRDSVNTTLYLPGAPCGREPFTVTM
jgi:hypothetical protein